jgi:hypothetical protein
VSVYSPYSFKDGIVEPEEAAVARQRLGKNARCGFFSAVHVVSNTLYVVTDRPTDRPKVGDRFFPALFVIHYNNSFFPLII